MNTANTVLFVILLTQSITLAVLIHRDRKHFRKWKKRIDDHIKESEEFINLMNELKYFLYEELTPEQYTKFMGRYSKVAMKTAQKMADNIKKP